MDGDCTYEEFRACLRSLQKINRWLLGYRPTLRWLEQMPTQDDAIHILDVGSGGGDLLRTISHWANKRRIKVELAGIDLNPYAARAAQEFTTARYNITWVTGDAMVYQPANPVDIAVSSLMAHHLEDDEIVALLKWLDRTVHVGWFINDLERSERSIRMFGLVPWHPIVRHDGPVSFRRAFLREDWLRLLDAAQIPLASVTIENWRPGRLCVGRWK